MATMLFLALAVVYLFGIAGVVFVDSLGGAEPPEPESLEHRLALVRATEAAKRDGLPGEIPAPRLRRFANTGRPRPRAVESIVRAFTPVPDQRMRSDVAASGSDRPSRSE